MLTQRHADELARVKDELDNFHEDKLRRDQLDAERRREEWQLRSAVAHRAIEYIASLLFMCRLDSVVNSLEIERERNSKSLAEMETLRMENFQKTQQISEANHRIAQLTSLTHEQDRLQADLSSLRTNNTSLQQRLDTEKRRNEELSDDLYHCRNKLESLQQDLQAQAVLCDSWAERYHESDKKYRSLENDLQTLIRQNDELKKLHDESDQQFYKNSQSYKEFELRYLMLHEKHDKAISIVKSLQEEQENLYEMLETQHSKLSVKEADIIGLTGQLESLHLENKGLKRDVDARKNEIIVLREKCRELSLQNTKMSEDCDQGDDYARDLLEEVNSSHDLFQLLALMCEQSYKEMDQWENLLNRLMQPSISSKESLSDIDMKSKHRKREANDFTLAMSFIKQSFHSDRSMDVRSHACGGNMGKSSHIYIMQGQTAQSLLIQLTGRINVSMERLGGIKENFDNKCQKVSVDIARQSSQWDDQINVLNTRIEQSRKHIYFIQNQRENDANTIQAMKQQLSQAKDELNAMNSKHLSLQNDHKELQVLHQNTINHYEKMIHDYKFLLQQRETMSPAKHTPVLLRPREFHHNSNDDSESNHTTIFKENQMLAVENHQLRTNMKEMEMDVRELTREKVMLLEKVLQLRKASGGASRALEYLQKDFRLISSETMKNKPSKSFNENSREKHVISSAVSAVSNGQHDRNAMYVSAGDPEKMFVADLNNSDYQYLASFNESAAESIDDGHNNTFKIKLTDKSNLNLNDDRKGSQNQARSQGPKSYGASISRLSRINADLMKLGEKLDILVSESDLR